MEKNNLKTKRNLSGIYFRFKNESGENESGEYENRAFEDLPEKEQDEILNSKSDNEWLKSLIKQLANTINTLGEQFDIVA